MDKKTSKDAIILQSKDGILYYNYDDTKRFVFERKGYIYDTEIPLDTWFTFAMQGMNTTTKLFINGKEVAQGELYKVETVKPSSSSFLFALPQVGKDIIGTMDNIVVYHKLYNPMELY